MSSESLIQGIILVYIFVFNIIISTHAALIQFHGGLPHSLYVREEILSCKLSLLCHSLTKAQLSNPVRFSIILIFQIKTCRYPKRQPRALFSKLLFDHLIFHCGLFLTQLDVHNLVFGELDLASIFMLKM